ncbi:class I SAM-dependent methyltransferase [Micromonospora sp. NPDC003776]
MTAPPFDPTTFKQQQSRSWDAISAGWDTWRDSFEAAAAPVTRCLLDLAGLCAGQRVLDLGCGVGEPAMSAAQVVGPSGCVVGVDISPEMVARAARRASHLSQLSFQVGDMETFEVEPGSVDVVLSRWGLMFAVDRVAAMRRAAAALVPGGILAAAVWADPGENPLLHQGFEVISRRLGLDEPTPGTPGPFTMADPGLVVDEVRAAGFAEADLYAVPVLLRLSSAEAYARYTRAVTAPALLDRLGWLGADDGGVWTEVAEAAQPYTEPGGGVAIPGLAMCMRAVTPSAEGSG